MTTSTMGTVILGIDPGTCVTGYGLIRVKHHLVEPLDYGCITPPKKLQLYDRYLIIYENVLSLITKYSPDYVAIENQFVHKNAQSALKLGIAKGLVILAAKQKNIPIQEYSPKEAKLAVVGKGSASKEQVQRMMQLLLHLKTPPTPEDASDALALALCHAHTLRFKEKIQGI